MDDHWNALMEPLITKQLDERLPHHDWKIEALETQLAASVAMQAELAQSLEGMKKNTAQVSAELARLLSLFSKQAVNRQDLDALKTTVEQLKNDREDLSKHAQGHEVSYSAEDLVRDGLQALLSGDRHNARVAGATSHTAQARQPTLTRSLESDETLFPMEVEAHLAEWKRQGRSGTLRDFAIKKAKSILQADPPTLESRTADADAVNGLKPSANIVMDMTNATRDVNTQESPFTTHDRAEGYQQTSSGQRAPTLPVRTQNPIQDIASSHALLSLPIANRSIREANAIPQGPLQRFRTGYLRSDAEDSPSSTIHVARPRTVSTKRKAVAIDENHTVINDKQRSEEEDDIQFEGAPPRLRAGPAKQVRKPTSSRTSTKADTIAQDEIMADVDHQSANGRTRRSQRKGTPKHFGDNVVRHGWPNPPSPQVVIPKAPATKEVPGGSG